MGAQHPPRRRPRPRAGLGELRRRSPDRHRRRRRQARGPHDRDLDDRRRRPSRPSDLGGPRISRRTAPATTPDRPARRARPSPARGRGAARPARPPPFDARRRRLDGGPGVERVRDQVEVDADRADQHARPAVGAPADRHARHAVLDVRAGHRRLGRCDRRQPESRPGPARAASAGVARAPGGCSGCCAAPGWRCSIDGAHDAGQRLDGGHVAVHDRERLAVVGADADLEAHRAGVPVVDDPADLEPTDLAGDDAVLDRRDGAPGDDGVDEREVLRATARAGARAARRPPAAANGPSTCQTSIGKRIPAARRTRVPVARSARRSSDVAPLRRAHASAGPRLRSDRPRPAPTPRRRRSSPRRAGTCREWPSMS